MKYHHYKNKDAIYEILFEGTHTETKEQLIIYKNIKTGQVWVRPKDMFYGTVLIAGKETPRFTLLED